MRLMGALFLTRLYARNKLGREIKKNIREENHSERPKPPSFLSELAYIFIIPTGPCTIIVLQYLPTNAFYNNQIGWIVKLAKKKIDLQKNTFKYP